MTAKQREILLRINELVKKLGQPPQTTYAPSTGQSQEKLSYQPPASPLPSLPKSQP